MNHYKKENATISEVRFSFLGNQTEREETDLPDGAASIMKPVDESKRLVSKIADPVRSSEGRRMEQDTGSSTIARVRFREPIPIVKRQIFAYWVGIRNGAGTV